MKTYTIGKISKIVDLPPKTIRFYEETGIISAPQRADNGYRVYPETAIKELLLIKHIRYLGLPIREMKKLMKGCENGSCAHTKIHVISSIDDYVLLLTEKIQQFTQLKKKLQKLKSNLTLNEDQWDRDSYCCNILGQLAEI